MARVICGRPVAGGGSCTRPQGHRLDLAGTWESTQCRDETRFTEGQEVVVVEPVPAALQIQAVGRMLRAGAPMSDVERVQQFLGRPLRPVTVEAAEEMVKHAEWLIKRRAEVRPPDDPDLPEEP